MSIFLGLERITDGLVKHQEALVNTGAYAPPGVSIEVETREQFDEILEAFTELVEEPSRQLYSGQAFVAYARGKINGLYLDVYTRIPTAVRACEYCDDKHDCTHVEVQS